MGIGTGRASSDTTSKARIDGQLPGLLTQTDAVLGVLLRRAALRRPSLASQALRISVADKTAAQTSFVFINSDQYGSWMTLTAPAATYDLLYPSAVLDYHAFGAGSENQPSSSKFSCLHFVLLELPSAKLNSSRRHESVTSRLSVHWLRCHGRCTRCQGCFRRQISSKLSILCALLTTPDVSPRSAYMKQAMNAAMWVCHSM